MGKDKPWALVTGASSGIGLAIAKLLAGDGFNLILVARRQAKLEALAEAVARAHGIETRVLAEDLAIEDMPQRIFRQVSAEGIAVEVLVNNAGFGVHGPVIDNPLERQLALIQVNLSALVALSHLFASDMAKRGHGKILNVASLASFQPVPQFAVYSASKAFVRSFSESLGQELKGRGVSVSCLCPGAVDTEFEHAADMEGVWLFRHLVADASGTARAGLKAMQAGRAVVVTGWSNKLSRWLVPFTPRRLVFAISGLLMSKH